jgi:4-hydroxy-4-methyl-2-oxoglutarate aldolase
MVERSVLAELARFPTPALANGIETFDVRPHNQGYMDASVRCMFPELGVVQGFAATATIRASSSGEDRTRELWRHVLSVPAPRFVVVQDLDDPPGVGSFWGEVNSNIFQAFGCVGVITNGCVRDLDEMKSVGFHAFAGSVGVSHAYVHVEGSGEPVTVGGLDVRPGDLLQADQHGVISIPSEIAADLPAAIRDLEAKEQGVIAMFRAPDFSPESFAGTGEDVKH